MRSIAANRLTRAFIVIVCLMICAGCGRPLAQTTPHPDTAQIAARWHQFVPVGTMPVEIVLDPSGSAVVDGDTGRWRLEGGRLLVRLGGGEQGYSYTVSGYMMTLFDENTDTSGFYINPDAFAAGATGNEALAGQWAAFAGWGKMVFDGKSELASVVHTEAGDTEIRQAYAARDGILQTEDSGGSFTYNLYSMSEEGALLLAETSDYDNDVKQWTPYWKRVEPEAAILGQWSRVIRTDPGQTALPETLSLEGSGAGAAGNPGSNPTAFSWEYYQGGFVLMRFSRTSRLYAWCGAQGGVLFLGNPAVDECWYIDQSRYHPTAEPLMELAGRWETEDGAAAVEITGDGAVTVRSQAGEEAAFSGLAADGLLRLIEGAATWHAAYALNEGSLALYCAGLPVLGQMEMPVVLQPISGQ